MKMTNPTNTEQGDTDMDLYAVYEVGPQGVLIDTGHWSDLGSIKINVENCNYSFEYNKHYIAVPIFRGNRKPPNHD